MSDLEERLARLLEQRAAEIGDGRSEPTERLVHGVRRRRRRAIGGAALAVLVGGMVAVMLRSTGDRSNVATVAPPRVADCMPRGLEPWIATDIRRQVTNTLAPGAARPAVAQYASSTRDEALSVASASDRINDGRGSQQVVEVQVADGPWVPSFGLVPPDSLGKGFLTLTYSLPERMITDTGISPKPIDLSPLGPVGVVSLDPACDNATETTNGSAAPPTEQPPARLFGDAPLSPPAELSLTVDEATATVTLTTAADGTQDLCVVTVLTTVGGSGSMCASPDKFVAISAGGTSAPCSQRFFAFGLTVTDAVEVTVDGGNGPIAAHTKSEPGFPATLFLAEVTSPSRAPVVTVRTSTGQTLNNAPPGGSPTLSVDPSCSGSSSS